jgi:hypothetical protein
MPIQHLSTRLVAASPTVHWRQITVEMSRPAAVYGARTG